MKAPFALVTALIAIAAVPSSVPAAAGQTIVYDGWTTASEYIPGGDGIRIAITVRRPTTGGAPARERLPVIVTQDRSGTPPNGSAMRRFIERGYVWVSQDRRGTGASFGVQTGFVNRADAQDAKAVIEWSARQTFSSGRVVAMGCSNQGAWQYLVATMRPKGLVAIAPACASPQFFDDAVSINGVPMARIGEKPYAGECARPVSGARPPGPVPAPPLAVDEDKTGALLAAAIAEQRCGAAMLGQYWLHMPRDGYNEFAKSRPALDDTAMTNWRAVRDSGIAILQLGGWFDAAVAGQIEGQRAWGGRLIMGPWVHGNRAPRDANLPNADIDLVAVTLDWFDHYAKGARNGAERPGILYYTIHAPAGDEWRRASRWPDPPRTRLYFAEAAKLTTAPPPRSATEARHAPRDVAWFGGRYQPLARWSAGDMAESDAKSLVHTQEPLAADMEVTGAVTAKLWVSADARDMNVYAALEDVDPSGQAHYVTDGRARASWRKVSSLPWAKQGRTWHRGFASDIEPLTPDRPVLLEFDFFPTSYVFRTGHRLRIALTTSIGEDYQAPPLAGGKPVTLTLYRDAARPSSIDIPIVQRTLEKDKS